MAEAEEWPNGGNITQIDNFIGDELARRGYAVDWTDYRVTATKDQEMITAPTTAPREEQKTP